MAFTFLTTNDPSFQAIWAWARKLVADLNKGISASTADKLSTPRTIAGHAFDGSTNISINDTDLTGVAWTPYTPIVTAGSGTFTTVNATGRYKRIGNTVFVQIEVTITTNGTAALYWSATLPFAAVAGVRQCMAGRENLAAGFMAVGSIGVGGTTVDVAKYDSTYLGANGYRVVLEGVYEAA